MEKEPIVHSEQDPGDNIGTMAVGEEGRLGFAIPEDAHDRNLRIQELKREISEAALGQKRIEQFQKAYRVPDDALTDSDRALKEKPLELLQAELAVFQAAKKKGQPSFKKSLRKIAAFFSF